MKRAILAIATLLLTTSIIAPVQAQTVETQSSREIAAGLTLAPAESVLQKYFQAIALRNYQEAYNLLSPRYRAQISYQQFVKMYRDYIIKGVSIKSVQLMPEFSTNNGHKFAVEYSASYIQPVFSANDQQLPQFYTLVAPNSSIGQWLIDGIGTAP